MSRRRPPISAATAARTLEERVAELEATSARKGNRKVKLTLSGHVNEAVLFWDDGRERNAYVVSNNASRTRFRFTGDAKINGDWSAGYLLEIAVRYANSANRSQVSASGSAATSSNGSNAFDIRHSAWWLDSKTFGRVWVGNTGTATDGITEINLSNVTSGGPDASDYNNGFRLRSATGALTSLSYGSIRNGGNFSVGEGDRNNTVKYVSPTLLGLNFQAAWSDDDAWDIALRYSGEFSGFRFAAGVGYQESRSQFAAGSAGCANVGPGGSVNSTSSTVGCSEVGLSASAMHVDTGLFLTGAYGIARDNNRQNFTNVGRVREDDSFWFVQGGIEKNYFGFGPTTLFAQYVNAHTGDAIGFDTNGTRNSAAASGNFAQFGAGGFVADSGVREFSVGINQNIAAAAMELYVTYHHVEADVATSATGSQVGKVRGPGQTFDAVIIGSLIRF